MRVNITYYKVHLCWDWKKKKKKKKFYTLLIFIEISLVQGQNHDTPIEYLI